MEKKIIRKIFEWPKIIESASRKFDLHKIPFYFMNFQLYFMHIGVKVMKIKIISLLKIIKLKEKKY